MFATSSHRDDLWRSFQLIEVRVGEEDPGDSFTSITGKNTRCSTFWNRGESMKYYDFKCPTPGIKGKYVTITSARSTHNTNPAYDILSAAEVEIFGNHFSSKFINGFTKF
jgi:hypothetical protein